MAKKSYSVRKAGMRNGKPHYSSECNLCSPPLVIASGGKSKSVAEEMALTHITNKH